ncbi:hypothetical protein Dimus_018259, partial [Dionaea muscipula]
MLHCSLLVDFTKAKRNRRSFGNGASFKIPPKASSPLTMCGSINVQAAKEFESELKKDPDTTQGDDVVEHQTFSCRKDGSWMIGDNIFVNRNQGEVKI